MWFAHPPAVENGPPPASPRDKTARYTFDGIILCPLMQHWVHGSKRAGVVALSLGSVESGHKISGTVRRGFVSSEMRMIHSIHCLGSEAALNILVGLLEHCTCMWAL